MKDVIYNCLSIVSIIFFFYKIINVIRTKILQEKYNKEIMKIERDYFCKMNREEILKHACYFEITNNVKLEYHYKINEKIDNFDLYLKYKLRE